MHSKRATLKQLTIKITHIEEKGPSTTDGITIDTSPDRILYHYECENCSREEFIKWFERTEYGGCYAHFEHALIDIGGAEVLGKVGDQISVNKHGELKLLGD